MLFISTYTICCGAMSTRPNVPTKKKWIQHFANTFLWDRTVYFFVIELNILLAMCLIFWVSHVSTRKIPTGFSSWSDSSKYFYFLSVGCNVVQKLVIGSNFSYHSLLIDATSLNSKCTLEHKFFVYVRIGFWTWCATDWFIPKHSIVFPIFVYSHWSVVYPPLEFLVEVLSEKRKCYIFKYQMK